MATYMILFVRAMVIAIGAVVSGFLVFWVGFQGVFILLAIFSILMFIPANMIDVGPEEEILALYDLLRRIDT